MATILLSLLSVLIEELVSHFYRELCVFLEEIEAANIHSSLWLHLLSVVYEWVDILLGRLLVEGLVAYLELSTEL